MTTKNQLIIRWFQRARHPACRHPHGSRGAASPSWSSSSRQRGLQYSIPRSTKHVHCGWAHFCPSMMAGTFPYGKYGKPRARRTSARAALKSFSKRGSRSSAAGNDRPGNPPGLDVAGVVHARDDAALGKDAGALEERLPFLGHHLSQQNRRARRERRVAARVRPVRLRSAGRPRTREVQLRLVDQRFGVGADVREERGRERDAFAAVNPLPSTSVKTKIERCASADT